jgi:glycosyltransferase involved in cell wall biosynthesis
MKKLLYIGNKLAEHGYNSTSIETLGSFLEEEGYQVYYASSKKNKFLRLLEMISATIKHSKNVDYVLIDTYSTKNFWYAFIISQLCRLLSLKYIPKLHGGDLPRRIVQSKFLSNLIFENAYINISPSYYLIEAFNRQGYKNIKYIPNTIDLRLYPQFDKQFKTPKLLWVRSFSTIYNPIMAIKVFMDVRKMFPDAELCMVGPKKDNSYEKTIQFAKQNNVAVKFTGKLSKEEWIALSANYNIFINTTHFDNTPISVIEAMSLGIPVVSTNVGGIPFLLEHDANALLVGDNNSEAMTRQIVRIFTEPELAENLCENAKNTINNFDWKIVKRQWLDLLY